MLTELSIQDFAIIDQTSITFNDGLTVLTGETGAGKSIIIDAVQLLAGGRGSVEFVKHGTKKAQIEGLFTIDYKNHPIYHVSTQYGIEIEDEMVVLHRTITAGGKSICRVNGKLVTLGILKEFGKTLLDVHSQHETQSLMNPENHIELLDTYDKKKINKAKEEYKRLYDKLITLQKRYKQLNENEQEMSHRLDLLEFQMRELEQTNLAPDEDKLLEDERAHLANFEKIDTAIQEAYNALYGEQKGIDWLNKAQVALQNGSSYNAFIAEKAEELTNHYFIIEELTYELRNYSETLQYDGGRLNEIEERLDEINRLKKKYGPTVNDILAYMGKIEEEIEQITNKDSHLIKLKEKIDGVKKDAYLEAKQLHDLRKKAATSLMNNMQQELQDLYLKNASFSVAFTPDMAADLEDIDTDEVKLHKNGFDYIHFLISTNPGEPLKEMNKIASGGELSRFMLVLKKIFAKHQGVTSVIFDEVDTGVSGRVAQAMAEKIYEVSHDSQVLCITHLPQVAAMGDTHKLITKKEKTGRTSSHVLELTEQGQTEELGRMITGTKLTDTAKEHAKELLHLAAAYKNKNQG